MNPLHILSHSQQVMNNHNSQLWMNQLINLSRMTIDQSQTLNNGGYRMHKEDQDKFKFKNPNANPSGYVRSSIKTSSNRNNNNQRKRLKYRRYLKSKTKAPLAPRNTTSFIMRAKKLGGITSSPSLNTPDVLHTPVFSPSSEDLVDAAKEEWGVDGYGTMKGLIRIRSCGNNEHFEMICPKYDHYKSCVLENRVDDQGSHIAQLEEQNLIMKERLLLMEKDFSDMRMKLQGLEMQSQGFIKDNNNNVDSKQASN